MSRFGSVPFGSVRAVNRLLQLLDSIEKRLEINGNRALKRCSTSRFVTICILRTSAAAQKNKHIDLSDNGSDTVTLKMHDLKMTDKENYGVWKMQDWKMTDKLLANCEHNYVCIFDAYLANYTIRDAILTCARKPT